jgi:hypothetical protein
MSEAIFAAPPCRCKNSYFNCASVLKHPLKAKLPDINQSSQAAMAAKLIRLAFKAGIKFSLTKENQK